MKDFIELLKSWGTESEYIDAIVLVGSYARGTNTKESDVDLCIITTQKEDMLSNQSFLKQFGEYDKKQTEYYGACTSLRVFYHNGLEVEFGIVEPAWISRPLDAGTQRVLLDGFIVLVDKKQYFDKLELK